ncbi:MAG: DUF5131 family protein [Georgenia sp.]
MADQRDGGIAWTDATWNPIRGCTRVSEGCRNCYAEGVAARFSGPGLAYEGLVRRTSAGPRWTGAITVVDDHMADPLRWTRPRRIFVNSMSDLFHEKLSDEQIARVFAVMYLAHQHTFQVLTKRATRMREVLTSPRFYRLVLDHADAFRQDFPRKHGGIVGISDPTKFPHANVWLGVSVENQQAAEERIPHLLETPAALRWLSCEPLIGPLDLSLARWLHSGLPVNARAGIDWTVIGGESGPSARPFDLDWARDLVRQCRGSGVRPFVKQLGAVPCVSVERWRDPNSFENRMQPDPRRDTAPPGTVRMWLKAKAGGDPAEWPEDLRVREFPR